MHFQCALRAEEAANHSRVFITKLHIHMSQQRRETTARKTVHPHLGTSSDLHDPSASTVSSIFHRDLGMRLLHLAMAAFQVCHASQATANLQVHPYMKTYIRLAPRVTILCWTLLSLCPFPSSPASSSSSSLRQCQQAVRPHSGQEEGRPSLSCFL